MVIKMETVSSAYKIELEADSASLCFDSHDDALNFADKQVKDANRWLAVHDLNIANHYVRGDLEIRVIVRSGTNAEQFHFVFRAIPNGSLDQRAAPNEVRFFPQNVSASHGDGGNDSVFVGVAKGVQSVKKVIPSFVWLERAHDCRDFVREVFTSALYSSFELNGVVSEGKVSATPTKSEHHVIKGRPSVNSCVLDESLQIDWHGFGELVLMDLLARVRIDLGDMGAWLTFEELGDLPFKFGGMTLCSTNTVMRVIE